MLVATGQCQNHEIICAKRIRRKDYVHFLRVVECPKVLKNVVVRNPLGQVLLIVIVNNSVI